jgi:protein-disulfide isomerase
MRLFKIRVVLSLVPLVFAACGATSADSKSARKDTPAAGATEVVATGDGFEIRRDELDRRAADRLAALRQQEYDIRREVLDDLIDEKLVEKEAKARGVTSEALLKAEVGDKSGTISDADIDAVYERAKGQLGGRSKEDVRPEIERYLKTQRETAERSRLNKDLRARSKVTVRLDAPRVEVKIADDAPSLGPAKAPVTLVEFSDYQCPFCHRAQATVDELLRKYGDKLRFIHQDFPLESHPRAIFASRASRCAGDQGKYWEYHRGLLSQPTDFSDADLVKRAEGLSLDAAAFKTCVDSKKHDGVIRAAQKAGSDLGVTGTPAFFVNGRMLSGARPIAQFEAVIDEELARVSTASN